MSVLAEKSVIGALLIDRDSIGQIYGKLEPNMFCDGLLGGIYNEFLRGYENRKEVNLVTLQDKLANDMYSQNDILEVLKDCMSVVVTSTEIKSYAKSISADHKQRKANEILNKSRLSANTIDVQIGELITELENLQDTKESQSYSIAEITKMYKDEYFKERVVKRVKTGFGKLDDIMFLEGGDLTIIGARPSVGKSALAAQIAIHMAKDQGKRVGFYNLEMKNQQMYERFVSNASGLSLLRIKSATRFLNDEKEKFDKANDMLEKQTNLIITVGAKTVKQIEHECRHMQYDVLIVDYLQLLSPEHNKANRQAEVGEISRGLKHIAMELNIPVIALSQLNRASEGKESKEPTMAELREAGDLEQDASNIILLWNLDEQGKYKGSKIEKNRQGTKTKYVLEFNGEHMRFDETDMKVSDVAKGNKYSSDDNCPFN